MSRAKKTQVTDSPAADNAVEYVPQIEPANEPEVAQVVIKNRLHQEWVEMRPQSTTTTDQTLVQVIEEDDHSTPSSVAPPAIDPIEQLLEEISASSFDWTMTVWRLPNFDRDFNGSMKARKILCGSQPFDTDYEDTIQRLYAKKDKPNNFLVVVRRDNRIYKILPVVQAEPVDDVEPKQEQGQSNNAIPASATTNDAVAELQRQLKIFKQMQEMFAPAQQPATVQQAELSPEAAMLKLLEVDSEKLAGVRKRIFGEGGNDESASWFTELKPFLPVVIQGVTQWLTNRQTEAATVQSPHAAPLPPQPQEPTSTDDVFFQTLWNAANQNAPLPQFLQWLDMFSASYPQVEPYLNTIVDLPPLQAAYFCRRNALNAHPEQKPESVAAWIENFQIELKRAYEEPELAPEAKQ